MVFKIVDGPISEDELLKHVRADEDGAVLTFAGVVRNHSNNQNTEYLTYEAYKPMAEREMAKIGTEVVKRWAVNDIGILHRVGRLEIGDISVLIAISSPHRGDGFTACQYAIDTLKQTVPIWKKEVSIGGEYWVEGPNSKTATR